MQMAASRALLPDPVPVHERLLQDLPRPGGLHCRSGRSQGDACGQERYGSYWLIWKGAELREEEVQ